MRKILAYMTMIAASYSSDSKDLVFSLTSEQESSALVSSLLAEDQGRTLLQQFDVVDINFDPLRFEDKLYELQTAVNTGESTNLPTKRVDSRFFSLVPMQDRKFQYRDNNGSIWVLNKIDVVDNIVVGNPLTPFRRVVAKYNEEKKSNLNNTPQNIVYAIMKLSEGVISFNRIVDNKNQTSFVLTFAYEYLCTMEHMKLVFHVSPPEIQQ